jgi:hypothetical protein
MAGPFGLGVLDGMRKAGGKRGRGGPPWRFLLVSVLVVVAAAVAAFLLSCSSREPARGARVPADDQFCPAERPFAYQPADMQSAERSGCTPAWNERRRVTPEPNAHTQRKMLVACCPGP